MRESIRILHVVDSLGSGGLENGLVNLAERLDPDRFEHIVYTIRALGPNADRLSRSRVRVMCLHKKETDSRIQTGALVRAIREVKPDVVHSRNWPAIEAVMAGRWAGSCSLVHSEHGLDAALVSAEPRRRVYFRRLAFELAHRVLSVSEQLRDLHAQRTGFRREKITVIHNGVDRQQFFPHPAARARVRAELGLAQEEFCIGCVGNLFPVKDHRTLLDAVNRMSQRWAGAWRLVIIGEGPERSKLEAFVNTCPPLRGRVSFLGSSRRVPELLQAMDVYVLSSIAEGICNSLLEAMATGLAVVATSTGGNPEVVVDGRSGLLFPVANAEALAEYLVRLARAPECRFQLGREALARVRENFSIEAMVENYGQVYRSLNRTVARPVHAVVGA